MSSLKTCAAIALSAVSLSACATKGYVRQQVETGVSTERAARVSGDSSLNGTMTSEFTAVKGEIATLKTDVQALRSDLTALRTEFGAKITAMEDGMKFAMPVNFAYDDTAVRDEDRPLLDRFAQIMNKYYGGAMLTVEGFADPAGSTKYNIDLSQRRADNVAAYLFASRTGGRHAEGCRLWRRPPGRTGSGTGCAGCPSQSSCRLRRRDEVRQLDGFQHAVVLGGLPLRSR